MVYVFLAEGFEEIEALTVVDILRRAEIEVKTVSVKDKTVMGAHGIEVTADILKNEVEQDKTEAVVLPGGIPGTPNLKKDETVKDCVLASAEKGKYVCAICAAPSILGEWGLLRGKTATCYPGFEDKLAGAKLSEEAVCVDGNILTSRGAGTAAEFAFAITSKLKSRETADRLRAGMIYAEK